MTKTVIIDGDWGGDEMQLAAVLLASKKVDVIGATAVFGNTTHDQVFKNAGDILHLLNANNIPFFPGAQGPGGVSLPEEGDGAHGANGVGGVNLEPTPAAPQKTDAVDFILETLRNRPAGTVTITATGPLTNIALALAKDPETMARVGDIIVMGGCTADLAGADVPVRKGNITPDAEFNFYMAAKDAAEVLHSGLPITLFPMNCTHQLTLTPEREKALRAALAANPAGADAVLGMMRAPIDLDRRKFNLSPTMHDVHTALYLLHPALYEGRKGYVDVTEEGKATGRTDFTPSKNGTVLVMEKVKDADKLFSYYLESVKKQVVVQKSASAPSLPKAPKPSSK